MQCWVRALFLPEIRLQLAAVTLAEELNFTRAAERLRITQLALRKQTSDLESQVGVLIFQRSQRRVELTGAGQVFIRGCRNPLAILERSVRTGESAQDEMEPLITKDVQRVMRHSRTATTTDVYMQEIPASVQSTINSELRKSDAKTRKKSEELAPAGAVVSGSAQSSTCVAQSHGKEERAPSGI